jgi:hypothetical protein
MPRVYTLGTKAIMSAGYKAGKENRRRYNQEFAENVKNNKSSRSNSAYSASMSAYNSYRASKDKRKAEKLALKESDSDSDGLGEYTPRQLSSSSVGSSAKIKQDYENPTDEQNSEAYKNSLFKKSAGYKFKTNQWRSK